MGHLTDSIARDPDRTAGVLLHPTSLPGRHGIGDLGPELIAFLDWAHSAGFRLWQVLPLNPPGYGNSPYGCLSSYAGNPLLISPQRLLEHGFLPSLDDEPDFDNDTVDFGPVTEYKTRLLRRSFAWFDEHATDEQRTALKKFEKDNAWLPDWALYASLKERYGGKQWTLWPRDLAMREKDALAAAKKELAEDLRYHKYVQWLFFTQWAAVREAAFARDIKIMGDVPIYVAGDSADVWANRHLFQLDDDGEPTAVAGVPPDYFSATGQRWGNPLYRWDAMKDTRYRWWVSRLRAALRFADIIRLDHFRGFQAYWEVPAHEETAKNGQWRPGPGQSLFDAIRNALGNLPLVAEDLGHITEEVHALRQSIGVPGMKILQFAFGQNDSPHLPHRYTTDTVVYTGTHDNDTACGWYETTTEQERANVRFYLGSDDPAWAMIRSAYTSVAEMAIVPVQDILGLGSEGRMNRPGDAQHNWSWRLREGALTANHALRLCRLATITGRV